MHIPVNTKHNLMHSSVKCISLSMRWATFSLFTYCKICSREVVWLMTFFKASIITFNLIFIPCSILWCSAAATPKPQAPHEAAAGGFSVCVRRANSVECFYCHLFSLVLPIESWMDGVALYDRCSINTDTQTKLWLSRISVLTVTAATCFVEMHSSSCHSSLQSGVLNTKSGICERQRALGLFFIYSIKTTVHHSHSFFFCPHKLWHEKIIGLFGHGGMRKDSFQTGKWKLHIIDGTTEMHSQNCFYLCLMWGMCLDFIDVFFFQHSWPADWISSSGSLVLDPCGLKKALLLLSPLGDFWIFTQQWVHTRVQLMLKS